jgi:hypothetical protein
MEYFVRCFIKFVKISVALFVENLKVHNERLREVLERMRKYNLKLQPDK